MSNYEIMILVNPQSTEEEVKSLLLSVLSEENTKIERLERTELAYPINKLTRATYYLVSAKAAPELMSELTRKLNIDKSILRSLIINLDSEKGLKPRKVRRSNKKPMNKDGKKPFVRPNRESKPVDGEAKVERKPRAKKPVDAE
ncbi:30S ribosomal protein S6 [Metamycoplasma neophronis]|uniref:Small ribosomal subunit protein bS6 n=1 Tax=Metamycoplasma neophronis TaxID=872983 RepID=A0ABY2Z1F3_9BACT|nr:30S ribosomal protein S6 [Metamycoplasma neophronis]TPR54378.1 30S ribosomal protein S6 [Metamycoplasma neophronis]